MFPHSLRLFPLALAPLLLPIALAGCLDPDEPGNLVPKTVDEDPALPRIEVAGTLLHAEAFGDPTAPTVMVLHGGPGGDYRSLLPLRALADDGYRVVFWDQRGAGLSQRHDASTYTLRPAISRTCAWSSSTTTARRPALRVHRPLVGRDVRDLVHQRVRRLRRPRCAARS